MNRRDYKQVLDFLASIPVWVALIIAVGLVQ